MVDDAGVARRGSISPVVTLRDAPMEEAMSVGGMVFHRHVLIPLDRARLPQLTLHSTQSGPVTIGTIQYSAGVRVETGPVRDGYQINIPLMGPLRTARNDETLLATPSRAAVYGLHQHAFEGFETSQRMLGVKIDKLVLERRLEVLLDRSLHGAHIEFALGFALDSQRGKDWYTVLQLLARRIWVAGALAQYSSALLHLQDALITGFLIAAPHSYQDELSQPVGPAAPRAVRRAVQHVCEHPEASLLTVPELAALAGVSVRALQSGFRDALDTSPLAFLRDRRLTHARRELEESSPRTGSVAEIAERWGFAHHGRFSVDYRRRFGEQPSQTLSRI
ncbi:AraC family transcriptional regulator [Agromyces sp. Soil535]|uniref:helix-turn-helix transcriptional regulator n=1 Tax=Agromyces sp. Soil535 TaxID=1736390 RepID=UPI00138EE8D5|nr:AraC family transcriptional regulator [Agromyces sp. Soil535]